MTDRDAGDRPSDHGPDAEASSTVEASSAAEAAGGPSEPPRGPLGTSTFTIEGRAAPGLFVVGWLATIMGGAIFATGVLAGVGAGAAAVGLILAGLALLVVGLVAGAGSQAIERHARRVAGYAGPSPALVFLAVVPLGVLLVSLAAIPLRALGVDPDSPVGFLVGLLILGGVYVALIRLLVVGTGSLTWREMGIRRPGAQQLIELAVGALMAFPVLAVSGLLAALLGSFLATPPSTLPITGGVPGMLVNLVSAVIVTPVTEETFFRGFATTAWLRGAGPNAAIVRGALLFAAAHALTGGGDTFAVGFQWAVFAFLVRMPAALALGWVFVRSRSLYASIGLHALFNGIPFLVLLLAGRG